MNERRELAWTILGGIVVMLLLPFIADFYTLTVLTAYAMLALSLALVWGHAGILCFGQAAFFGLGAYAFAIGSINFPSPWIAFFLSMIVPALFAAILGAMLFYGRLSDVYLAVVTLVVTLLLYKFMNSTAGEAYVLGKARLGGYNGIPGFETLTLPWDASEYIYDNRLYYFAFGLLILVYACVRLVLASPFGRMVAGVRENELRAELMGYNVPALKTAAFAIGGAIAGLAGCIFANWAEIVTPNLFSLGQSAEIIIWVIVGGAGTLIGPMLGAAILGLLKFLLGQQQGAIDNLFIMGVLLMLAVLILPRGIFPSLVSLWKRSVRGTRWGRAPARISRRARRRAGHAG